MSHTAAYSKLYGTFIWQRRRADPPFGDAGAPVEAPHHRYLPAARTIHTGPRAKVIGWPDVVVNIVPPSGSGRDQRAS